MSCSAQGPNRPFPREQGWIGLVAPTEMGGQQLPRVVGTAVDEMFIGANAAKYAAERVQGSDIRSGKSITEQKVAIINHPDVRRMLMTVRALAEGGRALLYATAFELDLAERAAEEGARAAHGERAAKLAASGVPAEAAARQRFLAGNEDARFWAAKIESARFFVHQVLSQNRDSTLDVRAGR